MQNKKKLNDIQGILEMMNRYFMLGIFWLLKAKIVLACSCINRPQINILDYQRNDLIFSGTCKTKIIKDRKIYAVFSIERLYKGNVTDKEVEVYISQVKGDCGLVVKVSEKWLLLTNQTLNGHYGSICGQSGKADSRKKELSFLEKISSFMSDKMLNYYFNDVNITISGHLLYGKEDGKWEYVLKNKSQHFVNYKNGLIVNWLILDARGNKLNYIEFKNGQLVKYYNFLDNSNKRLVYQIFRQRDAIILKDFNKNRKTKILVCNAKIKFLTEKNKIIREYKSEIMRCDIIKQMFQPFGRVDSST